MADINTMERTRSTRTRKYEVTETRSATQEQWDNWLEESPGGGHILQSYEWGEHKSRYGWKPVRLTLSDSGKVVGVGQFLVRRTPFVGGHVMYCPKGPWIPWDDEDAVRTFFKGVVTVAKREKAHTVKIEPEVLEKNEQVKGVLKDLGFRKARYDLQFKTTMVVDLTPSEDEMLARMKGKTRYNIRLAQKKGVHIVEDDTPQALEDLYNLHRITAERDGFVLRPKSYYMAAWTKMKEAGRAHFFFAEHEGERLAGMVVYTFGHKYWYMIGASSNEKRNLMPTYLLQWEVMRWAKSQGLTYYDMVAIPNPDNLNESDPMWGLYRFKSGFGGEIFEFLGIYDLHVNKLRAWAWYNFEPLYYRLYMRLKNDNFY